MRRDHLVACLLVIVFLAACGARPGERSLSGAGVGVVADDERKVAKPPQILPFDDFAVAVDQAIATMALPEGEGTSFNDVDAQSVGELT